MAKTNYFFLDTVDKVDCLAVVVGTFDEDWKVRQLVSCVCRIWQNTCSRVTCYSAMPVPRTSGEYEIGRVKRETLEKRRTVVDAVR